jgi:hypothetical protein
MGYVSFVVGAVVALHAMRSLIQLVWYRSKWITFLDREVPKLFRKTNKGRVIEWSVHRHPLTGETYRFEAWYEYVAVLPSGSPPQPQQQLIQRHIDSQDKKLPKDTVQRLLDFFPDDERGKQDDSVSEEEPSQEFLYLTQHPHRGVPLHFVEEKRKDMLFWARYVDIGIAFFGIHIYLLGAFIYSSLSEGGGDGDDDYDAIKNTMIMAFLAPIFMFPYLSVEANVLHQRRVRAWMEDPFLVSTEVDILRHYCNLVGPSLQRKFYAFSFALGISVLVLYCGWVTLVLGLMAVYSLVQWVDSSVPVSRETLQTFHQRSSTISASILDHWLVPPRSFFGTTKFCAKIYYIAPSGEQVVKDFESTLLYDECIHQKQHRTSKMTTFPLFVDPEYPCSGYPRLQFFQDYYNSWGLGSWQIASFMSLWIFLMAACLALDIDLDHPPEETAFSLFIVLFGFSLLIPQASVLRQNQHNKYLLHLYEGGVIVDDSYFEGHDHLERRKGDLEDNCDDDGSSSVDESYDDDSEGS